MSRCTVLILVLNTQRPAAESLRDRMFASWPDACPPEVRLIDADRWHELPASPDAIIALVNSADDREAFNAWLDRLHGTRHSVLVLTDEVDALPATDPTVLPLKSNQSDALLFATLHGVLHRGRVVRELQNELCLIERFHGGLESQLSEMHEELQLAAMVQREFIPSHLPVLHGVDFGVLWRPANYVSGDIYDVARIDEDHLGVFIADAVGHGVPAALMTMVIARSLTLRDGDNADGGPLPPGEVLARLNNRLICRREGSTRFATGAYALVDCRSRTLRLAGAGHPPPLHYKPHGDVTPLVTDGGLLGIFRDETYSEVEIELELDDHVLFYSDGFEVAFPSEEADNYEQRLPTSRYMEEFTDMFAQGSTDRMIQHIQERIDAQRGSLHQIDDLTLLCLHAGPIGEAAEATGNLSNQQSSLAASR